MKTPNRFELFLLGQQTPMPRELLEPAGSLVVFDLYPIIAAPNGQAFVMPAEIRPFDPRQPLPVIPRSAQAADLRAALASLTEPCSKTRFEGRLVLGAPGERFRSELVRIHDRRADKAWLRLTIDGNTLRFAQRGRVVEVDLTPHAGLPIVIAAHWGPTNVSLELQGGTIDPEERAVAISFDGPQPELRLVREVVEGEAAPNETFEAHSVNWCLGLVCLARAGTTHDQLAETATIVTEEAGPLFKDLAGLSAHEGTMFVAYVHASRVEVDQERFERWRNVFGWYQGITAHCEVVLMRHPLAAIARSSALNVVACAVADHLDRLSGADTDGELVPPLFVDRQDVYEWFWYHATAGHYLVDDVAAAVKRKLEARIAGRQQREHMVVLQSKPLADLFDAVGRDWLERRLEKEAKKRAKQSLGDWVKEFSAGDHLRNTAVAALRALRNDLPVVHSRAAAALMDLWASASKLAADVAEIWQHFGASSDTREAVQLRLRELDGDPRKCEFEIESFAALLRCAHSPRFVPTSAVRTPDIEIPLENAVFVECAELAPDSAEVEAAKTMTTELIRYLQAQVPKRKRSLLIEIAYRDESSRTSANSIIEVIKPFVIGGGDVTRATVAGCEVTLRELGAWGRVWRLDAIHEVAPEAAWVQATGYGHSTWSPRGFVCNASAVAVTINTTRRLITSLENRLRDKAKSRSRGGQFPDGHPGVCAISLGDARAQQAQEVIEAAAPLVESHADLSALVLFWSERETSNYIPVARRWYAKAIRNKHATNELPPGFQLPDGLLATAVT